MKTVKYILILIFFIMAMGCFQDHGGISGTGGQNDNGGISGTGGPKLPPQESMGVINLPNETFAQKRYKGLKLTSHFDHAILLYQRMSASVFDDMSLQSKLFSSIYEVAPTQVQTNEFHWVSTDTNEVEIKNVDLLGKKTNNQVEWLMNILTSSDIEDSLLEGLSDLNNTKGSWEVLKTKGQLILQITWEVKNDLFEVTYTNVSSNEHNGDSIILQIIGANVSMEFNDVSTAETIILKWNVSTQEGSVKDANFIDGQERFWDSNLENLNDTDNF
jgi:hypothetical protein